MTRHHVHLALSLELAILGVLVGCGGDDGSSTTMDAGPSDVDGAVPDTGTGEDGGGPMDAGGACDETTCIHGTCVSDRCDCDPGWTGDACDTLNAPADEGVLLWFDADDDASFEISEVAGVSIVDGWTARVAMAGPVVVAALDESDRPLRMAQEGLGNGRETVVFSGVDQLLTSYGDGSSFWTGMEGVDEYTLFVVFSFSTIEQAPLGLSDDEGELGIAVSSASTDGSVGALHRDTTAGGAPIMLISDSDVAAPIDLHVVAVRVAADGGSLRVDGTEVASNDEAYGSPNLDQTIVSLGVDSISGDRFLGGSVAEVIVFGGALRDSTIGAIEEYLTAKWL